MSLTRVTLTFYAVICVLIWPGLRSIGARRVNHEAALHLKRDAKDQQLQEEKRVALADHGAIAGSGGKGGRAKATVAQPIGKRNGGKGRGKGTKRPENVFRRVAKGAKKAKVSSKGAAKVKKQAEKLSKGPAKSLKKAEYVSEAGKKLETKTPSKKKKAAAAAKRLKRGKYELMPTDLTRIKMFAKENVGAVCDALVSRYHDIVLSATNFKLVQNCEDLLYHQAERRQARKWRVDGVSVISGHHDQVVNKLKTEISLPTIVFACEMVEKLKEQHNHEAMHNVVKSDAPVFIFDRLVWWRPGPLFTFEPPFKVKKFPRDPTINTFVVKTKDDVGGQERLDKMANALADRPDTTIEKSSNGVILSVSSSKPQNLGDWKKKCKEFYQGAEKLRINPFQCVKVRTPSFDLASLAAVLNTKIADSSVTSGLWKVAYTGAGGQFTLQRLGEAGNNKGAAVEIMVAVV